MFRNRSRSILGTSWARTDENGFFEFRSTAPSGVMDLTAKKDGFQPLIQRVDAGSSDLRLVLLGENRSVLEILPPEGVEPREFQVTFRPSDGNGNTQFRRFDGPKMELGFLAEGSHEVAIQHDAFPINLVKLTQVAVGPGVQQDPRLTPVDLRSMTTAMRPTVLQHDGTEAIDFQFRIPPSSSRRNGKSGAMMVLPKSVQTLTIWTPESRAIEVPVLAGDQEIQLPAPLRLHLDLVSWPDLKPGEQVEIRLHHTQGLAWLEKSMREMAPITFSLPHLGTYNLSMSVIKVNPETGQTQHTSWLEMDGANYKQFEITLEETRIEVEVTDPREEA